MELSIVIPVYNEEKNVTLLHQKIFSVCQKLGNSFEIIFINDGSRDNTLHNLKKLRPIKIINFRRNFGQTAALDAGIKSAEGEIIITMDGDLQNNPEDIPNLLAKLNKGYAAVSGWRKNRKDPFLKRFFSYLADFLRQFLIKDGIHDSGCTLKAYKRKCFEGVDLYGEMHRFIPAILKIRGYKIGEVVVKHYPRVKGKTKYNWKRLIKGFIDVISVWFWQKYSNRPLHFFGGLGLFLIFLGFLSGLGVFYERFILDRDVSNNALTLLSAVLFLAGLQLFVSGILADILIKTYYKSNHTKYYSIKEIIENK